jgi:hypothetical protein
MLSQYLLLLIVEIFLESHTIVACLLKDRNVKPSETSIARERLYKHIRLLSNDSVAVT